MRCPVPPRIPDIRGEEPFPLKHTTPRLFFFSLSLFSLTLLFSFYFLGYGVVLGSVRGDPSTASYWGVGYPMATSSNPLPSPSSWLFMYFLEWSGGYGYRKFARPGPQGPQPVGSRNQRFVGGLFSRKPRALAQYGVQGSVRKMGRWLPHAGDLLPHGSHPPFLITSPKGGMRWKQSWLPQPGD